MSDGTNLSDAWSWQKLFVRYFLVYASLAVALSVFSNWRFFPSLNLSMFPENWGKFIFYTLWVGVPYLLLAQAISILLNIRFQIRWLYLAEAIFVMLFLIGPFSLIAELLFANSQSTFSFGVSEGDIIRNGVVTELGHRYFFMLKMQEVFHMSIYLVFSFLVGRRQAGGA
jgi:hypothetical protein